jgi:hypothetical protein
VKRSAAIRIPLVTTLAAAALAAGCGSQPGLQQAQQGWQTCVDRAQGTSVEQTYCEDDTARTGATPGYYPHYYWYYFPRSYYWEAPPIGTRVPTGGAYGLHPFSSTPMARTGSVVRGGFGSTASAHASGS